MKQHSENAISVSVIGGADGPTSIFVAGTGEKRALKARIRDSIYRYKRKRAEKRIVAAPHSLAETVQYAKDKYGLTEAAATDSDYIEQMRCLKENLVLRQKPELLGSLGELPEPDLTDETAVQAFLDLLEARSRKIAQLPDDAVPMDFHLYKIKMGDGLLQWGSTTFGRILACLIPAIGRLCENSRKQPRICTAFTASAQRIYKIILPGTRHWSARCVRDRRRPALEKQQKRSIIKAVNPSGVS